MRLKPQLRCTCCSSISPNLMFPGNMRWAYVTFHAQFSSNPMNYILLSYAEYLNRETKVGVLHFYIEKPYMQHYVLLD